MYCYIIFLKTTKIRPRFWRAHFVIPYDESVRRKLDIYGWNQSIAQVLVRLSICPEVCSLCGIWGIMKLSCLYTTTTCIAIVGVYITIAITIVVAVVAAVAIVIAIVIAIYIDVTIFVTIYIDIYTATTISIGVASDMGLHLWLKGTYQLFQCPDLYAQAIFSWVDMFNFLVIIWNSVFHIIEGIGGFVLHDNIGTVESNNDNEITLVKLWELYCYLWGGLGCVLMSTHFCLCLHTFNADYYTFEWWLFY